MPSCAFDKCRNHTRKDHKADGVTFHAFPSDAAMKRKWIAVLRTQRREFEWVPTQHSRVCSMHFSPGHIYTTSKGYKRIKKKAVPFYKFETGPSVSVKAESVSEPASPTSVGEEPSTSNSQEHSNIRESPLNADPLSTTRCNSPSGLSDIGSSDLEGALDTTKEVMLKKKLKAQEEKCKGHVRKIKTLQAANSRLCEKNKTLKLVLTKLKRKIMIFERNPVKYESNDEESSS